MCQYNHTKNQFLLTCEYESTWLASMWQNQAYDFSIMNLKQLGLCQYDQTKTSLCHVKEESAYN
jgi:hypothetical protein